MTNPADPLETDLEELTKSFSGAQYEPDSMEALWSDPEEEPYDIYMGGLFQPGDFR